MNQADNSPSHDGSQRAAGIDSLKEGSEQAMYIRSSADLISLLHHWVIRVVVGLGQGYTWPSAGWIVGDIRSMDSKIVTRCLIRRMHVIYLASKTPAKRRCCRTRTGLGFSTAFGSHSHVDDVN